MSDSSKIKHTIESNAHAFLGEAVDKALLAKNDKTHWQFAILHLVQSLELSLKTRLKNINAILVYENIDNPKHMVSVTRAIQRLEQPLIGGVHIGETDKIKIVKAIELRNQITHAEFEYSEFYAEKKFFELYAFVVYFQATFLEMEVEEIIDPDKLDLLLLVEAGREELLEKADTRINEEGISSELILTCTGCLEETFVIEDEINTCYLCRHTESVRECSHCKGFCVEAHMVSFFDELDYYVEEGLVMLHNNYGYSDHEACSKCAHVIIEDIHQQQELDEFYKLEGHV